MQVLTNLFQYEPAYEFEYFNPEVVFEYEYYVTVIYRKFFISWTKLA